VGKRPVSVRFHIAAYIPRKCRIFPIMKPALKNKFRITLVTRSGLCGAGGATTAFRDTLPEARKWIAERRELQHWDSGEIMCVSTLRTMKVRANRPKRHRYPYHLYYRLPWSGAAVGQRSQPRYQILRSDTEKIVAYRDTRAETEALCAAGPAALGL